jgi:hypothetical protein
MPADAGKNLSVIGSVRIAEVINGAAKFMF